MQHRSVRPALAWVTLAALAAALTACGGAQPSWDDELPASQDGASQPAPSKPRSPPGRFARAEVDEVLVQGPVWILQRVAPEEVIRNGAFVGWRVMAMPNEWGHLALKAGDVVTQVNGAVIERPEDLWSVWMGLATAKELRVAYEHEGAMKELVMPIDGPPNEAVIAKLQNNASPSRAQQPKGTVVIEDGTPPPADGDSDAASAASGGARESVSASGGGKASGAKDAQSAKDAKDAKDAKGGDRRGEKKQPPGPRD
jgi:hypothetical protein